LKEKWGEILSKNNLTDDIVYYGAKKRKTLNFMQNKQSEKPLVFTPEFAFKGYVKFDIILQSRGDKSIVIFK
jgi:hypothetical protein